MRWTVLLPTFNRPDTLALSIASILAQTDADLELFVVGDGCTDNTADVVASFGDPRVRWFDLPKGDGYGYANRRLALESATGDYIAFASHDDLWSPNHLELLGAELDRGHEFAYSVPLWALPSGEIVPLPFDLRDPPVAERFAVANFVPATFVVARMSAVIEAGGWPVDVPQSADWRLWQRILALPGSTAGMSWEATALHFRSVNRAGDHAIVADLLTMHRDAWPTDAMITPVPDVTLQAAAADAMRADPAEWWHRVGIATMQLVARTAFYRSSTSWRFIARLRAFRSLLRGTAG